MVWGSTGHVGGLAHLWETLFLQPCVCLWKHLLERCESKTNMVPRIKLQEDGVSLSGCS